MPKLMILAMKLCLVGIKKLLFKKKYIYIFVAPSESNGILYFKAIISDHPGPSGYQINR